MSEGRFDTLERLRWPLIIGLPLLSAALAHTLFSAWWQTNDDVAMEMFASGVSLSPAPTPYLLFMNALLGQLLSSLYSWWPHVAWYAWLLFSVRVVAGMAMGAAVLDRKAPPGRAVLLGIYLCTVDLVGHICPQFSLVAATAAQAAILLWLSRSAERPWRPLVLAAFLGLLGVGVAVRSDHAFVIVLLAVPLLVADALAALLGCWGVGVWGCGKAIPFRSRLWAWAGRTGGPFLTAGLLAVALLSYNAWFYAASPGWSEFHSYNWLRAQFTDFGRGNVTDEPALARAGWSPNDLTMLKAFFFADREVYSAAKFQAFLSADPSQTVVPPALRARAEVLWSVPTLTLLLGAALFPVLFVRGRALFRYGGVCAAVGGLWLFTVAVVGHYAPQHFVMAILSFAAAVGVAVAQPIRPGAFRSATWGAGVVALALLAVRGGGYLRERSALLENHSAALHAQLHDLDPRPEQLYVVWGSGFPYEYLSPFDSLDDMRPMKMYGLGCCTNSPLMDGRLREFDIPALVPALYTRDNVFLICDESQFPLLRTFVAEHHGVQIECQPVFSPPGALFKVYKIRPVGAGSGSPRLAKPV